MSRLYYIAIVIGVALLAGGIYFLWRGPSSEDIYFNDKNVANMRLTSLAFADNDLIPVQYTCKGDNINPPLSIGDVPEEARSLVLIVDDPDAPAGTWTHWLAWNIDPRIGGIEENSVPEGAVEGTTDFGSAGYGGPCPPSGTHRYFFRLYALDEQPDISSGSDRKELEKAMDGHVIAKAELVGLFSR